MIRIDFQKNCGAVKPLHGVNNSPMRLNGTQPEFQAAGIPFVRTHDPAGAWGGTHYGDIPNIFPDFDADENDPASYDFAFTDAWLKPLVEAGVKPFYRLGVTIENNWRIKAYNIHPPKDPAKWARICEHVIRHYNEGWANGFHWDLEYWEIWNEPENPPMWTGSMEEFFELYRVTATHLRKCFPDIRIGGYGGCGFYAVTGHNTSDFYRSFITWFHEFCKLVRREDLPFDFYSWHLYTTDPALIVEHSEYVRNTLDQYGLQKTQSIFNEWNYVDRSSKTPWDDMKEMPGAAFVAAAFALMQHSSIDSAMYYDALPTRCYCGLFYFPSGRVTPCYYAFKAFNELYKLGTEAEAVSDQAQIYTLAAKSEKGKAFFVVNNGTEEQKVPLVLNGTGDAVFRQFRLDADHRELQETGILDGAEITLPGRSLQLFLCCNEENAETAESGNSSEQAFHAGLDSSRK